MADVTHAELKEALRFAGELEKFLGAFRGAREFSVLMSRILDEKTRLEKARDALVSESNSLSARILALQGEIAALSKDSEKVAAARSAREAEADRVSNERIAAAKNRAAEVEEMCSKRKAEIAHETESVASDLAAKATELERVKSELAAIRSRFA